MLDGLAIAIVVAIVEAKGYVYVYQEISEPFAS